MTASPFLDDILIRTKRGMGHTSISSVAKPRGERMWKSLTSGGSAFIKRIPGAGVQHSKQLAGQLAYVNGKAKGTFGFASGVDVGAEAFEEGDLAQLIDAWSQDWKGRPRNGHTSHIVLSFPDDVSNNAALAIAQEWCVEMFESEQHIDETWEYVAALHTDTDNPHVHVILNNRGVGGQWFSISLEGVFNPQMMRDRMTDIADDYGVHLESLTRADRGLYRDPLTSADVYAAREGRILNPAGDKPDPLSRWQLQDMQHTAEIFTTLAEFAEVIGAPMIAKRAYLSAAALFAGDEVPKGIEMNIDLDVTANRDDIRTSLIGWTEQNADQIEALPEPDRMELLGKIDKALDLIETDASTDLTEDTVWAGFSKTPSSYLIPDVGALEARAALYVDEDNAPVLQAFVNENALDRYLVTGEVPDKFAAVMPAVAEAYEEMHSHDLSQIPKDMKEYVRSGANIGLDPQVIQERLINPIPDLVENIKMEREDLATIYEGKGIEWAWVQRFDAALNTINEAAERSVNDGIDSEEARFENLAIDLSKAQGLNGARAAAEGWEQVSDELVSLVAQSDKGELTAKQTQLLVGLAPVLYVRHRDEMIAATDEMVKHNFSLAEQDADILKTYQSPDALRADMEQDAAAHNEALDAKVGGMARSNLHGVKEAFVRSDNVYRDWQLSLERVEERIIDESKVYDKDGVSRLLQDAASTAATTGRADFADSSVGRTVLKGFVALEGKDAMKELASGNMDALADYVETPAQQRLAAKELLRSAKSVDVGLEPDEIENGLEAVDPNYTRSSGISL